MAGTATYSGDQSNQRSGQQPRAGENAGQQGSNRDGGQGQKGQQNAAQRDYQQLVRDVARNIPIEESRQTAILKAAGKTLRDLQADVQQAKQPQR